MDLPVRIGIALLVGFALSGLVWFGWGLVESLRGTKAPSTEAPESSDEEDEANA